MLDGQGALTKSHLSSLETTYEVGIVEGAPRALERIRAEAFDLLIASESVSDVPGLAFVEKLRDLDVRVPAILLAAGHDNLKVLRARELDAWLLSKPIDEQTLLEAVRMGLSYSTGAPAHWSVARGLETVSATHAKNEFRQVLELATHKGRVVITKYDEPRAVLVSFEEYTRLIDRSEPSLAQLSEEFDQMLEHMQTPAQQAGTDALFSMSSSELGMAATSAVKKGG